MNHFFQAQVCQARHETTEMSIDRGMNKKDAVHMYSGIVLSHKKEWSKAICSNMDRPRDYRTKQSKLKKERQILYDIAYTWNLKK